MTVENETWLPAARTFAAIFGRPDKLKVRPCGIVGMRITDGGIEVTYTDGVVEIAGALVHLEFKPLKSHTFV